MENVPERPSRIPEGLWHSLSPEFKWVLYELCEENRQLRERVRDLEARLNQNSSNSSRPPSSDPPWVSPKQKRPKGRKRGAQPGHPGHFRCVVPSDRVDHVVPHVPMNCKRCEQSLRAEDVVGKPFRHQVIELPEAPAQVYEHQLFKARCPSCRASTRAQLPTHVPQGNFGPRLQSFVALMTGRYRLSRREVQAVMQDVHGVSLSLGSVAAIEKNVSSALAWVSSELAETIQQQPVVNVDETGWREVHSKAWLWVAASPQIVVYRIARRRNAEAAKDLLGANFSGWLCSDRFSAYKVYPMEKRQICHAHLTRDFQKIEDRGGCTATVGTWGLREEKRLFDLHDKRQQGEISQTDYVKQMRMLKARMARLLLRGEHGDDQKVAGTCANIRKHWPALWPFAEIQGVEPTNNTSEQALRKGVLWRKGSFGTQSDSGSRFAERILTVAETCRRQGRHLFTFLIDSVTSVLDGRPSPSLLPHTASG